MRSVRNLSSLALVLSFLLTACVREPVPETGEASRGWDIPFCAAPSADVIVSTKSTMTDESTESVVYNLYVMVFDGGGSKVFSQFFDQDRLVTGPWTEDNQWKYSDATKSSGTIHLTSAKSSAEKSTDCKIVVIANLNSEMVNITPNQLDQVGSWSAMEAVTAELLQLITSRSGYFPMCGMIEHVDLTTSSIKFYDESHSTEVTDPTLNLERLDAKIQFRVQASSDPAKGIYNFVPVSWQVFNLPKHSAVVKRSSDTAVAESDFFDGNETIFETETLTENTYYNNTKKICVHGFSFYMMENRKTNKKTVTQYVDRDKKGTDGKFEFANDLATYIVLKGRITFNDPNNGNQISHAEVKYTIHLGDFGDGTNADKCADFNILRNHAYIYNIVIEGVEHIKAYVTTAGDPAEPGASGEIVVPAKKLYTCDSHYSTQIIDLYYKDLKDLENFAWWVRTPFSDGDERILKADGKFYDGGNQEIDISADAVDYNWVEFRVNQAKDGKNDYSTNTWDIYKPRSGMNSDGRTMTLPQLMVYLKEQVALCKEDVARYANATTSAEKKFRPTSDFDRYYSKYAAEGDNYTLRNLTSDDFLNYAKITVTAFVNEYYYEKDPTDANADPDPMLYKQFVNAPVRTMCIFSGGKVRGESSYVQADFIIQQYSIQSVYNVNSSDLNIGWGAEYTIDDREKKYNNNYSSGDAQNRGNNNPDNGRWDTMIEWNMRTASDDTWLEQNWATYLNLTNGKAGEKLSALPDDSYRRLRYACMSRNRDNDGDGIIDKDEIRWYMPASNQLLNLFLGSYGIERPAALYQRTADEIASNNWQYHVVGSDIDNTISNPNSNTNLRIVWSEECMTGSNFANNSGTYSHRCVRNFGQDPDVNTRDADHGGDVTYSHEDAAPDALIILKQYHKDGTPYAGNWDNKEEYEDVYLDFDCSRFNEKSLRYYTDRELAPHDEFNEAACLYKHFQTATISESISWSSGIYVKDMNDKIDELGRNDYCPEGYRLPNVRELGVICYFFNKSEWFVSNTPGSTGDLSVARTKWSFGYGGSGKNNNSWGWAIGRPDNKNYRAIKAEKSNNNHKTKTVRCVKDVRVE